MYVTLKKWAKKVLPKSALFRYESAFRRLLYLFYRGNSFQCNVCNRGLRRFISLASGDLLCPRCGSISRSRRLWQLLRDEFLRPEARILDVSPSRSLYRLLRKDPTIDYTGTDLSGDFLADQSYDLTRIELEDASFDLIICYHVLEHIEADRQAMRELHRVLSGGGVCLIQTPFKAGAIYENPAITDPAERLEHFGQEDHLRIYSVSGLEARLREAGFRVEIRQFTEPAANRLGFKEQEKVLICTKLKV